MTKRCWNGKNNKSMTIELITKDQREFLESIFKEYPALTLQNKGYEYIGKDKLNEEDKVAIKEVEHLLQHKIVGFVYFDNFRLNNNKEIQIRFHYNWGAEDQSMPFTGVGYITLNELQNGFKKKENHST